MDVCRERLSRSEVPSVISTEFPSSFDQERKAWRKCPDCAEVVERKERRRRRRGAGAERGMVESLSLWRLESDGLNT
jgi:hypothetical protein